MPIEKPKAPIYKSNSSSWHTVREGEPEPEEAPKRNFVPEWDDVENEDERPAIAGVGKNLVLRTLRNLSLESRCQHVPCLLSDAIVVETESTQRLKNPAKKTWKEPSKRTKEITRSPDTSSYNINRRSPSPVRGRSPEPQRRHGYSRSPSRSRSRSPIPHKRQRSPSRSLSPYSKQRRSRSRSMERMSSGAAVGLQSAASVKRDMEKRQQEHLDRMNALDPSKSGRDAETVYRDAQGNVRSVPSVLPLSFSIFISALSLTRCLDPTIGLHR